MEQSSATSGQTPPEQARGPDAAAQTGPGESTPGFAARGRLRRRARFLRKARELAYRDLGGLVYSLHRFGQRNDGLVLGKLSTLGQIDTELRSLETALGERQPITVLREAGITACARCAAIHGSEDRFCPHCGLPLSRHVDLPIAGPASTAAAGAPGAPAAGQAGAAAAGAGAQAAPAPAGTGTGMHTRPASGALAGGVPVAGVPVAGAAAPATARAATPPPPRPGVPAVGAPAQPGPKRPAAERRDGEQQGAQQPAAEQPDTEITRAWAAPAATPAGGSSARGRAPAPPAPAGSNAPPSPAAPASAQGAGTPPVRTGQTGEPPGQEPQPARQPDTAEEGAAPGSGESPSGAAKDGEEQPTEIVRRQSGAS